MNLYLSSNGLGNEADRLVSMLPANRRAAVIFNALDFSDETERKQATIDREIAALAQLGLEAEELDLRLYFGKPDLAQSRGVGLWPAVGNRRQHLCAEKGNGPERPGSFLGRVRE